MSEDGLDRDELLKDSEATLREVAGILMELRDQEPSSGEEFGADGPRGNDVGTSTRLGELLGILEKAAQEVEGVLDGIRKGRGAIRPLDSTTQQLTHVSGVLAKAEERLGGLTRFFDLHGIEKDRISREPEGP